MKMKMKSLSAVALLALTLGTLAGCASNQSIKTTDGRTIVTDGKPQIAIWTDAWLKRLALICGDNSNIGQWPAIPLLIAQGHDWHLLIVSKNDQNMTIREQIALGAQDHVLMR